MFEEIVQFIRQIYGNRESVPLHAPVFRGNEKKYLADCIDTTFVSYVGPYVTQFEDMIRSFTGIKHALATANGTLALHIALILSEVKREDEVLTQALTFVATVNAIAYCGASPVFIDSDRESMGMSPEILEAFLAENSRIGDDGFCYNKKTGKRIKACVPMHVFGHPLRIDIIKCICDKHNITLIEDAAESLGSYYKGVHTGLFGKFSILSFNGNKTITTGGGGMILTNDDELAVRAKHITTTAKKPHQWEFVHDEIGYNYRLPNVNAAIGCAQMENLKEYLENKRELALIYKKYFDQIGVSFFTEPENCRSNYWLNVIVLKDENERDQFLKYSNENKVMTRPVWRLMNKLVMFQDCQCTSLDNASWFEKRVVNIPSSVRL